MDLPNMYKDGASTVRTTAKRLPINRQASSLDWSDVGILQGIKVTRLKCTRCGTPNPDPPPPLEPEPEPEAPPKRKMWNRRGEEIEPPPLKLMRRRRRC